MFDQDWNDPKSKLQQCCLTLRTMDGGEPDIPIYKIIECKGPTNTRQDFFICCNSNLIVNCSGSTQSQCISVAGDSPRPRVTPSNRRR